MMRNFFLAVLFTSSAVAQNVVSIDVPDVIDPGLTFVASIRGSNHGSDIPVPFGVGFPPGFVVQSVDKPCEIVATQNGVTCTVDFGKTISANLVVLADDNRAGAFANVAASIGLGNTIFQSMREAQTFLVVNANDNGNGSLRDAITNANNGCTFTPCKVSFRIDDSSQTRIRPSTPLPAVNGNFMIDGTTQTHRISGSTIFIDGSNVAPGDGFTMSGCSSSVQGLAIGNFHGAAVHAHAVCGQPSIVIAANSIGLDPNGEPAPNDRGVVIDQPIGFHVGLSPVSVVGNVISANRSSGVFVVARPSDPNLFDQRFSPVISTNIIGLDRTLRRPRGNGASGIYVDGSAIINANYIAFNHDFGIGVADFNSAAAIGPNSIFANWQRGIDIGLVAGTPSFVPLIRSAHYDAATNRTLIDVIVSVHVNGNNLGPILDFYASDAPHPSGYGDGQYYLGRTSAVAGNSFTFAALGDWRGKWVSATEIGQHAEEVLNTPIERTSEFSNAVKVE